MGWSNFLQQVQGDLNLALFPPDPVSFIVSLLISLTVTSSRTQLSEHSETLLRKQKPKTNQTETQGFHDSKNGGKEQAQARTQL